MTNSAKMALARRFALGVVSVGALTWIVVGNYNTGSAEVAAGIFPASGRVVQGEAITGQAVMPDIPEAAAPLHVFNPPPADVRDVDLDALSNEEQAYVVDNDDRVPWQQVHAGFSGATEAASRRAKAQHAAETLGIGDLSAAGVVP